MLDPFLFAPITFYMTAPNKLTVTFDVIQSIDSVTSPTTTHLTTTCSTTRCFVAAPPMRSKNSISRVRFAKVRRVLGVYKTWRWRSSVRVSFIRLSPSSPTREPRELGFVPVKLDFYGVFVFPSKFGGNCFHLGHSSPANFDSAGARYAMALTSLIHFAYNNLKNAKK